MREVGFASDARHSRSNSLPTVHVGAPPWSPDDRMLPRSLEASLLRRASVVSVQCHWFQRPCWTDGKPTRNSRKNPNLAWCRLAPPIDLLFGRDLSVLYSPPFASCSRLAFERTSFCSFFFSS